MAVPVFPARTFTLPLRRTLARPPAGTALAAAPVRVSGSAFTVAFTPLVTPLAVLLLRVPASSHWRRPPTAVRAGRGPLSAIGSIRAALLCR